MISNRRRAFLKNVLKLHSDNMVEKFSVKVFGERFLLRQGRSFVLFWNFQVGSSFKRIQEIRDRLRSQSIAFDVGEPFRERFRTMDRAISSFLAIFNSKIVTNKM